MVRTDSEERHGPPSPRTEGDRLRRRNLADAASGVQPDTPHGSAQVSRIERFRAVVYLCGAPNADLTAPRRRCTEYAETLGWSIDGVVEDRDGLNPPDGRTGLQEAIERVAEKRAGAVLTPSRSMISPVPQEYNEIARKVESAGGFLQIIDVACAASRDEPH
ncbi:hypothetical protein FFZ77_11190 [Streptomyces katsurahamanus]|uniref:Recombinase family protein n=1 Tax=Streptomyces katsurahamanus TaxID=2577098 RepID=A0ABW9NS62_9ACTN|nr:hypothetical protein [Streptomyces katsurahamanus]